MPLSTALEVDPKGTRAYRTLQEFGAGNIGAFQIMEEEELRRSVDDLQDSLILPVSAIVGRRLIELVAERDGISAEEREILFQEMADRVQQHYTGGAALDPAVVTTVRSFLASLADAPDTAAVLQRGMELRGSAQPLGWGNEAAVVILALGLAFSMPLAVAKLHVSDENGEVRIELEPGIPQGFVDIAEDLRAVFESVFQKPKEQGKPR